LAENVKGWDKVLIAVSSPLPFVTLAVAGMDAVRFGWSNMPPALLASGIVLFVVGMFLFAWAMSSNKYFSTTVRIQYDRGHQTITSGPYQYVRHPGYMGSVLYTIGTPLLLGSWWALVPATLAIAAITVRTALENDTLQQELVGYAEYTKKVRYRLLPGVW